MPSLSRLCWACSANILFGKFLTFTIDITQPFSGGTRDSFEKKLRHHWLCKLCQLLRRSNFDVCVQAVTLCIHRNDCRKVFYLDVPHCLRDTELKEIYALNVDDALSIVLRCAANR